MIGSEDRGPVEDRDERQEPPIVDVREGTSAAAYSIAERDAPAGVSVIVLRGELDMAAAPLLLFGAPGTPS